MPSTMIRVLAVVFPVACHVTLSFAGASDVSGPLPQVFDLAEHTIKAKLAGVGDALTVSSDMGKPAYDFRAMKEPTRFLTSTLPIFIGGTAQE